MFFFISKVFLAKGNVPAKSYEFFIDILLNTIRDEIAGCIEKAYEKIAFNETSRMLFFSNKMEMQEFAEKVCWRNCSSVSFFFKCQRWK